MGKHWKDRMGKGDGWPDEDPVDDLTDYIKKEIEEKGLSETNPEMNLIRVYLDTRDKMKFEIASGLPKPMGVALRLCIMQLLNQFYPLDPPNEEDIEQDEN